MGGSVRAKRRDESESRVQSRCSQLYAALGGKVYWLSQRRPSGQTPGLPDLIVVFPGRAVLFHEVKRPGGKPSLEQAELRQWLAGTPVKHVLGGFDEAWQALQDLGFAVSARHWEDAPVAPSAKDANVGSEIPTPHSGAV